MKELYFSKETCKQENQLSIEELEGKYANRYFKLLTIVNNNIRQLVELYVNKRLELVIYKDFNWNDESVIEYHKNNYKDVNYQTQIIIKDNIEKIVTVKNFKMSYFWINIYNKGGELEIG